MSTSARQLVLLLAVAAAAFALAVTIGRATPVSAVDLPAAPGAEKATLSGVGRPVAIPALKAPRQGAVLPAASTRPAPSATQTPPQQQASPAQRPPAKRPAAPAPSGGAGGDVIVSG